MCVCCVCQSLLCRRLSSESWGDPTSPEGSEVLPGWHCWDMVFLVCAVPSWSGDGGPVEGGGKSLVKKDSPKEMLSRPRSRRISWKSPSKCLSARPRDPSRLLQDLQRNHTLVCQCLCHLALPGQPRGILTSGHPLSSSPPLFQEGSWPLPLSSHAPRDLYINTCTI